MILFYKVVTRGNPFRKGLFALVLSVLVISSSAHRSNAQSLSVAGNTTVETLDPKAKETLVVPLKADNIDPRNIRLEGNQPAVVVFNKSANTDLKKAFTVTYNAVFCQLEILMDKSILPRPGSYDLTVQYSYTDAAATKKTGKLIFTLVWPAATLENLAQSNVIRIDNGRCSGEPIQLRETGGKADVDDLEFSVTYIPEQQKPDLIDFKNTTRSIPAGMSRAFTYMIDQNAAGRLKDGETNFTATINSRSLSAPLKVSFKVIKNEWKGLIVIAVVFGLLLGFLLRKTLAPKIADTQAEENGTRLKLELTSYKKEIQDVPMQQDLDELLRQTTDALDDLKSFFADHTQVPQKLQAIRSGFETRRQAFVTNLNAAIITLLNAREALRLPGAEGYLAACTRELVTIGERLDKKDLFGANKAINALNAGINDVIQGRGDRVAAVFDYLMLPANLPKALPNLVNWVQEERKKYEEQLALATLTGTDYQGQIRQLVTFEKEFPRFDELLLSNMSDAYQALDKKAVSVPAFHDALKGWGGMISKMTHDMSIAIDQIADDGTLLDNLNKAWENAKTSGEPVTLPVAGGALERTGGGFCLKQFLGLNPSEPEATADDPLSVSLPAVTTEQQIRIKLVKIRLNYLWLTGLRYLILILLISAAAYRAYEGSFTGTWQQLLGIMFSSMTIDIAAEGLPN